MVVLDMKNDTGKEMLLAIYIYRAVGGHCVPQFMFLELFSSVRFGQMLIYHKGLAVQTGMYMI